MIDKPKYNHLKHHRRSIRLKGYDYSQAGAYFITICLKDRECLFGKITDSLMYLNDAGLMIDKWWHKIPEKFPDIELGEYVIMPNHFHAVVINVGVAPHVHINPDTRVVPNNEKNVPMIDVGANPCVCPNQNNVNDGSIIDANENAHEINDKQLIGFDNEQLIGFDNEHLGSQGEHVGSPLHSIVQWFKTMSTNEYIRNVKQNDWPSFNRKLWQRNYYEHIIRNEKSFQRIAKYIQNNPSNWIPDKFFIK